MKLETFFNKFDQFADAPDAVAKMRASSPNGAPGDSPGQRPGRIAPPPFSALKGRDMTARPPAFRALHRVFGYAPSGLQSLVDARPRALPWAGTVRPVGAGETGA